VPETPIDPRLCQQAATPGVSGWNTPHCRANLSEKKSAAAPEQLSHDQQLIMTALTDGVSLFGQRLAVDRTLQILIDLTRLLLRRETVDRRLYPLRGMDDSIRTITSVSQVLAAADPAEAAQIIREASHSQAEWTHNEVLKMVPNRQGPLKPVLDHLLATSGRVTTKLRRQQLFFPVSETTIDQIPLLLWRCAIPLQLLQVRKPLQIQFLLSLSLARMITGTWEDAAEGLGFSSDRGRAWSKYLVNKTTREARQAIPGLCHTLLAILKSAPPQQRLPLGNLRQLGELPDLDCWRANPQVWCPCLAQC